MIERIDGLVFTGNRVVVGHVELCILLDHIFSLSERPGAASQLGQAEPEQSRQPWSYPAARRTNTAAFKTRFPVAP